MKLFVAEWKDEVSVAILHPEEGEVEHLRRLAEALKKMKLRVSETHYGIEFGLPKER